MDSDIDLDDFDNWLNLQWKTKTTIHEHWEVCHDTNLPWEEMNCL
jgi:hypothetical protein